MPGAQCVVGGCTNKRGNNISLHQFPKEQALRDQWIKAIKSTGTNVSRVNWNGPRENTSFNSQLVCSEHFLPTDFTLRTRISLEAGIPYKPQLEERAVPSIFGRKSGDAERPLRQAFRKRECARIVNEYEAKKEIAILQSRSTQKCVMSSVNKEDSPDVIVERNACPSPQIPEAPTPIVLEGLASSIPVIEEVPSPSIPTIPESLASTSSMTVIEEVPSANIPVVCEDSASSLQCPEKDVVDQVTCKGVKKTNEKMRHKSIQVNITKKKQVVTHTKRTQTLQKHHVQMVSGECQYNLDDIQLGDNSYPSTPVKGARCRHHSSTPVSQNAPPMIVQSPGGNSTFTSTTFYDDNDETYTPSDFSQPESETSFDLPKTDPISQPKYVVFEDNLMSLFQQCPMCRLHTESEITQRQGSYIAVRQDCLCGYQRRWESQPRIGATPAGNVLMCAALLFSGFSASKIFRMFSFFKLVTVTLDTFWEHQKKFLWPAIDRVWTSYQSKVHESIRARGGRVIVAGDGRADSPGHSAKFGVYTMVDLETGKVIDMQLVQSNEVKSSYHMELEGLKRAVDNLKTKGITIAEIITDRHMQIQKWIRENLVGSTHSYDVWHIAKGLKKKLLALGKEKDCVIVNSWVKSITNHLYWSASSSKHGDGDLIVAKWKSVANHVQNVHNNHGDVYRACEHEQLTDRDWLKPGSKASVKLEDIILNKRLCTDIKKMSTSYQTSFLESLHSVMNHFAAKMYGYSYHGQLYRQQLAALHFDENLKREVKIGKDGKPQVKILFPKYKRNDEYTVKLCREEMTFSYVMELLQETVIVCEGKQLIQVISPAPPPPPLSSSKRKPNKTEALASLTSRFKKMKK